MDISAALAAVTAAADLAKLIIAGKIDDEVKAKAAELNNSILSLQSTIFSIQAQNQELLKAKSDLERQLIEIANWEKEGQRYQLHALCAGVFVYALKEKQDNSEPPHYICPNCYQESKKSILTQHSKGLSGTQYTCSRPECKAVFNDYENRADIHF